MTIPLAAETIGDLAGASAASGESTALGTGSSRSITEKTGVNPPRPKAKGKPPAGEGTGAPSSRPPSSARRGTGTQSGSGKGRKSKGVTGFTLTGSGKGGAAHKMVIAEFILCVVLIGMSPILTRPAGQGKHLYVANDFVRLTAVCLLFFILALLSNSPRSSRWAAAFGALVTLGTIFNASSAINALASIFVGGGSSATAGNSPDATKAGNAVPGVTTAQPGGAQVTGVSP